MKPQRHRDTERKKEVHDNLVKGECVPLKMALNQRAILLCAVATW